MPEPTKDRPSRNYEFLFLFSKKPDYQIRPHRDRYPRPQELQEGRQANAGSVWETEILTETEPGPHGIWRINQEASRYPARRHLAS